MLKQFCKHLHDISIVGRDRYGNCKECIRITARKRYKEQPEKSRESRRKWSRTNPEKEREYQRKYDKAHPKQVKERQRKWRVINKDRVRNLELKNLYGITLADYNKMFTDQFGKCKICGKNQSELKQSLQVDHDHKTGIVRGLLCKGCNTMLGLVNDSPVRLLSAIKYLTSNTKKGKK